jgi:predicted nucleic acid-binding protein
MKTRVYLDNCCFNRPFDDPVNMIVQFEAEAMTHIQREIRNGSIELAWSFILDYENTANPYEDRRRAIAPWKCLAVINIGAEKEVYHRADAIGKRGIRDMDALHIACAIQARCHYFLTTDKKVLKKRIDGITLLNPLNYVQEVEDGK